MRVAGDGCVWLPISLCVSVCFVCVCVCVCVSWKITQDKGASMVSILYIEHIMGDNNEAWHEGLVTLDDHFTGYPLCCPIEHLTVLNRLRYLQKTGGSILALIFGC